MKQTLRFSFLVAASATSAVTIVTAVNAASDKPTVQWCIFVLMALSATSGFFLGKMDNG